MDPSLRKANVSAREPGFTDGVAHEATTSSGF
jgi:hypothetical protein